MTVIVVNPSAASSSGCRIGYENLLELGTVVASSENASYPVENAYDWVASDYFRPAAGGSVTITLTLSAGRAANYFAFYGQDVHESSGSLSLEYHNGTSWVQVAGVSPADNSPRMVCFDSVTATQWRVVVTASTTFNLACVAFGTYLELPYGQYLGWTPPKLGRSAEFINSVSDGGTFLGRSYVSQGVSVDLVLQYASDSWVRTYWLPFHQHMERKPFFFCPDYNSYPSDAVFCWAEGSINPPSHTHYGFMGTTVKLRGVME